MQTVAQKLREALLSKKVWATVVGCVLAELGVDPQVIALIGAYILGQSAVDVAGKLKAPATL